jgi:hypothetical protein
VLVVFPGSQLLPLQQPFGQLALVHTHWPLLQVCPAVHTLPQAPQLFTSLCSLTHVPLQLVWPVGQTHALPEHTPPLGQVTHAPPQLVWPDAQTQLVPEHAPPQRTRTNKDSTGLACWSR